MYGGRALHCFVFFEARGEETRNANIAKVRKETIRLGFLEGDQDWAGDAQHQVLGVRRK